MSSEQPTPMVLLYDGRCSLCRDGSARLLKWARPGAIERLDFREPGVLDRFKGLVTPETCERAMQLVELGNRGQGARVACGAAAVVAALNTRRAWLLLTWLYSVPLLRVAIDRLYALIARNRMRLHRQSVCAEGECTVHAHRQGNPK